MRKIFIPLVIFTGLILYRHHIISLQSAVAAPVSPPAQRFLSQLGNQASSAALDGKTLTIHLATGPEVILDIEKSPDTWYSSLTAILDRARITGQYPRRIDLRFNRSIVTY